MIFNLNICKRYAYSIEQQLVARLQSIAVSRITVCNIKAAR